MAKKKKEYDTYDAITGTFSGSKSSKSSSRSSSVVYNSMTGSFSNVSSQKPITTVKSDTKSKTTQPLQTVKTTMPSVNKDGYEKTNQKYGYYKYQDYKNKKDYDIYKKDGKAYYYDPKTKTYNDMDTYEITTPEQEKEELKEAKKYGYKERKTYKTTKSGKRVEVLPNTIAERVELETSGLTKKEKKKYAKALIKQKDKEVKKSSYVREGNTLGELKYMAKSLKENTEPLGRIKDSYDYGKLQQEMSLAYSDMLKGKKVDISKIQKKIDNYNKFNKDVAEANTALDTYVKSVPGQLRGMKKGVENAGALGTIGAIGGGTIGAVATKTPQGAVAGAETGAKWLGGAGYVKGQAQNTYELESGATYQTLLEMGVPDKIARKEAKRVGTENALIESGESILDLLTFGKAGAATNALKEGLIKKYGAEALKKWGVSYATNIISEGLEEGTQEQRSIAAEKRAAEKAGIERDDSQDVQRILESAKAGGFGAAITGAGTRIAGMGGSSVYNITKQKAAQMLEIQQQVNNGTMTHEEANQKIEQVNNGTYEENKNIDQIAIQQRDAIEQAVQTGQLSQADAAQEIKALDNTLTSERERVNGTQEQTTEQLPTNTEDKLQNFRNSVANERVEDSEGFYKAAEKIIQDKDYNVILDSSITNEKGDSVNAVISNEDGITIRINPKSERAGEILLAHEITHGIETKEISDLIVDYASKNAEFNTALEDLKKAYGTEDVTPEVVADISGQALGHQEFINSLRTEKPNLFKQIYDKIVEVANKITGNSREALFVRDLKNKWEKAYRESTIESAQQNLKEGAKYSQNAEITDVTDSNGKQLSKGQVDFFEDSKVRDEDGKLIKVYHTTTNPVIQFNEFNPVGTPRYKFGNQIVIYSTDSKEMSGSYDETNSYEMADTKRLNNIEEAQQWLNEIGVGDLTIEGNEVYEDNIEPVFKYKTEEDLLRNLKSDIQKEYGNQLPIQYEAYLNMKKPYVVDAKGKLWSKVVVELSEEVEKVTDEMSKYKKELHELAEESEKKYNEYLGKASWSRDLSKRILLYANEDLKDLDYDGILGFVDNYKKFYDKAKEMDMGYNIPEPGTMVSDLIDDYDIEDLKENWDEYYVDNYVNMTIDELVKEYNKLSEEYMKYGAPQAWFEYNYKDLIDKEINANVISDNSWYQISKANFDRGKIEEHGNGKNYETNDIVKRIIEINKENINKEKYDGVIFKNVVDYGWGAVKSHDPHNVYVVFNSNQIKATDNLDPTSDTDIRYSEKADKWQQWLNKNFPSRGTTTVLKDKINNNTPTKTNKSTGSIKNIKQEVEEKTNKTMSKHIETSSKATGTVEDIKNMDYDTIVYDAMTNKKSKEQALRELAGNDVDTNVNDVHAKFRGTERLTHVDSAKITELMKQTKSLADEAKNNGNDSEYNKRMEQFRTLKGDYAVALSESGQFVQYAKVIKELDPDTQIDVLKKVIEREQRRGNKKYEDVTINEKLVEKYKKAKTDEERDTIMEEIKDDTARQIKITFVDKANEFRFLSMLGNLKTHGRNIFGNTGMYSLQSFKDGVAAIGEDIYNKVSKNGLETRSKTLKPATKEVSKFVSDKVDVFLKDQKNKYNESRGMKGDLEGRTKKFSDNNIIGKALNKASDLNSKALDFEDRYFSSKMTKQAMKGFLTANGIETNADIEAHPELVAQALDYALFKGKEATFHQDSTTATAIRNLRDKLYTGSGFSKLGGLAVDTTLPFISTPANIAKNALEYTPVIGFGDINKQFQQAPDNMKANVVIDTLSKQFTGGALMAVGAFLASKGLIKGAGDDDKEDKTEASLGNASYSIKIGKSTYDLSWLSPTAIPFFEGVEVFNAFKKAKSKGGIKATDTADLIDTMFGTLNPMTDMSVLQSVERVITSIAYGGNAVKSATSTTFSSYLQQYIPTLLSQFAQIGDSKQRNTNTGGNVLSKTYDQIKYKIPGARNTLPEKVDVWGNTNKTANNRPQRAFEALLSPANRKDYKVDKTTKELERLARETDDTAMLPTVKNKSLRVNKKDYELIGKDFVDLQRTYGKTAKKNLDKLIESNSYKNASDTEKQKMVRKLYDYASYKAKENYAKNKGINFDSGDQTSYAMIDAFKIPYEKYVESKVSGNDSAAKMINKLNKAGFTKSQKAAIMNYFDRAYYVNEDKLYSTLENSNLSDKQKELVRKKYEKSITDSERERYKRADKIGVDYDLYASFRTYVTSDKARGESRSGGKTKRQKVIDYIENLPLSAKQKYALYDDWNKNQRVFQYYK